MLLQMRRAFQRRLRDRGIELRKVPAGEWRHLNVFRLAAECLMAKRGDALTFVQVGANDGVFGDPIRDYVTGRGWRGILVEPQPDVFAKLKENYAGQSSQLIFEQVAIGPEGTLSLYRPPLSMADTWGLSVVSADPKVAARTMRISENQLERIDVPSLPLDAVLERHDVERLDVLQIDVEGLDWAILKTLDFQRHHPTLIQFESGHMPRSQIDEATQTLNRLGYDVYYGGWQGDTVALSRDWASSV